MKFFIIITSLVILSVIPGAYACTCVADPDYDEIVKESDVAFIGQVISKEKIFPAASLNTVDIVKFNVFTGIKNIDTSTFEFMQFNLDEGSCGIDYKVDEVYFVSYSETYQTNMCSTRPISEVGNITFENGVEIDGGQVEGFVVSESSRGELVLWWLLPLGIIIFTGIWIWRKKKQT